MPRKELSPPDENRKKAERLTDGTTQQAGAYTAAGRPLPERLTDGTTQQAGAYTAAGRPLPERLTDGKSVKNTKSQITGAIERGSRFAETPSVTESPLRLGAIERGSEFAKTPFVTESPLRPGAIERGSEFAETPSVTESQLRPGAIERGSRFAKASSDEMFSDEEVTRKPSKSNKSAREYAMALVAARAYTERGLREKMRIRGYGCDETDDAVEYLKGFGYINDLRLAQNAAEKLADKLNGKRKIFAYLASKGISRDTVAEIDLSEIDFKENCRTLALKLQAAGKPYEKIVASLTRAGFSSSEIYYAMKVIQ